VAQVVVVDEGRDPERRRRRGDGREVRDRGEVALDEVVGDREGRDPDRLRAAGPLGEVAAVGDVVGVGDEREGLHGAIVTEVPVACAHH
jgi:hypothetical protein